MDVNVSELDTEAVVGLLVMWSAVTSADSYSVQVERTDRGDSLPFTTTTTDFIITSQAAGGYESVRIQVTAVNGAGYGPASIPLTSRTPSIPPGGVGPVMVSEGDVEVIVSWSRPLFPNGVLTGYMVSVEGFEGGTVIGPVDVGSDALSTVIDISTLEDGVPYYAIVVAVNEKGSGLADPLLLFVGELTASVVVLEGGKPLRSDNGDIVLLWETPSPVQARGIITSYQINFEETVMREGAGQRRQLGDCSRDECVLKAGQTQGCCLVDADQTSATISGLDPSKAYNVSIRAVNGAGLGEAQMFIVEATAPPTSTTTDNTAAIIGGVVAVIFIIAIVFVAVIALIVLSRHWGQLSVRNVKEYVVADSPEVQGVAITTATNMAYEMVKQREGMVGDHEYAEVVPFGSPPTASQEYEIPSLTPLPLPAVTST